METTAEQLIRDKGYDTLSQEELLVVQELCDSEEEFQSMKQFFREMDQLTLAQKTIVSPAIKESLDNIFAAKHPGIRANWSAPAAAETPQAAKVVPLYQRKWARIAAVLLLAAGTLPFWLMVSESEELKTVPSIQTAKNEKAKETAGASSLDKKQENQVDAAPIQTEKQVSGFRTVSQPNFSNDNTDYKSVAEDVSVGTPEMNDTEYPASNYRRFSEPATNAAVTYSFSATPSPAAFGYTSTANAGMVSNKPSNLGMLADLNPEGRTRFQLKYISQSPLAASLDQQPDELLDMLVPAF